MNLNGFVALIFALFSSASALAVDRFVNYGDGIFGPTGCNESSQTKTWREMLQQVNVVAHPGEGDRRGGVVMKGPKLGLSPAEILQVRQTTGYIKCTGTKYGNGGEGSGAMIGDGGQIVTNVHTFIDEQGHLREPLSECYFLNQETPNPKKVMLDFSPDSFRFKTENPYKDGPNDMAFVRIKNEIKDSGSLGGARKIISALPFKTDTTGAEVVIGAKLILISAAQLRMETPVDPGEPVVQNCNAQKIHPATADHSTIFISDCSSTKTASGGIALVRDTHGELVNVGIIAAGGKPENDNTPFSIAGKSYAIHIGFDSITREQLAQLEEKKPISK